MTQEARQQALAELRRATAIYLGFGREEDGRQCRAGLVAQGAHYPCDLTYPHPGLAHSSRDAEAIWIGDDGA